MHWIRGADVQRLGSLAKSHVRKFFLTPHDINKVPAMAAYYLYARRTSPQEGEYNPLQKMAYTGVFVVLAPLILLSGMTAGLVDVVMLS